MADLYRYRSIANPHVEKVEALELRWELDGDPLTDDYLPEEISAAELWGMWIDSYANRDHPFGRGWMTIYWGVDPAFEFAPFAPAPGHFAASGQDSYVRQNFLTWFTWPEHASTGEPVNFAALPVRDKLWRPGRADKGGFVQQHTGWKPSPLQPVVHMSSIARAAGVDWPDVE